MFWNQIWALFWRRPGRRRGRIILAIPVITKRGKIMANYEIKNDTVATIAILTTNSAGTVEPAPAGDTFSVTSSNDASLKAEIADLGGAPAVRLTPLVRVSPGITITVSDSAGLQVATQLVDIVEDVTPTNVLLDLADATTVSQPVPTAPGP